MKVKDTDLPGVKLIEPQIFKDKRGCFFETHSKKKYAGLAGVKEELVQSNVSISEKNVIRGLHLQRKPHEQGKLVQCIKGAILDCAVDLRVESPNFGEWTTALLSEENHRQLWIPAGFGHGFQSLEEETIVSYQCSNYYNQESEISVLWDDKDIGVQWLWQSEPKVSDKDKEGVSLKEFKSLMGEL